MKITSFNPLILSQNAYDIVELFEEMGFKKAHHAFTVEVSCLDSRAYKKRR